MTALRTTRLHLCLPVVLTGSALLAQTATWSPSPATGRVPASGVAAVRHDAADRTLFLGGFDDTGRLDTWSWDGSAWTLTEGGPEARFGAVACYDPVEERIVMFGGLGLPPFRLFRDTWEYDGAVWQSVLTRESPAYPSKLAWDGVRGKVMAFRSGEVWQLDADGWTRLRIGGGPIGFILGAAWHAASSTILVVAATNGQTETWTWTGSGWLQQFPAHVPPVRTATSLIPHPRRPVVVMTRGVEFVLPLYDTWEWDGVDWRERFLLEPLGLDRGEAIAADVSTGGDLVAFGSPLAGTANTWVFTDGGDAARVEPLGQGCVGSAGIPTLTGLDRPWLGSTLRLSVSRLPRTRLAVPFGLVGLSADEHAGIPLPWYLDDIGMRGCPLRLSPLDETMLVNRLGTADWAIPIPAAPALNGMILHLQVLTLDHEANAFGATLSDAVSARCFAR